LSAPKIHSEFPFDEAGFAHFVFEPTFSSFSGFARWRASKLAHARTVSGTRRRQSAD
jgi:hypothetical protein